MRPGSPAAGAGVGASVAGRPWARQPFTERYLGFFLLALAGYALFGRGFAYFGVPPLFIGEVVLATGVVAALRSGCLGLALDGLPSRMLALFIGWVMVRTLPGLPAYRFEAARDAVIALYGLFAFITAAVLIERRQRLLTIVAGFRHLSLIFPYAFLALFPLSRLAEQHMPTWPISNMAIIILRAGDSCVHLAGIAVFALLGFRRCSAVWVFALLVACMMAFSQNRGGMLSVFIAVGLTVALMPLNRTVIRLGGALALFVALGLALDISIPFGGDRALSFRQVGANVATIVLPADDEREQGTKAWRLQWWNDIIDYTVHGPYFWKGKGFGLNLAIDDGYQVNDPSLPPLRSPHNVHMTILARAGVPGLVLWAGVVVSWAVMIVGHLRASRRRGDRAWFRFFVFLLAYWLAFLVNAGFDVALEGPMMGIWFWSVHGLGIGAAALYRREQALRPFPDPARANP